jgi:pimeloyl-ACP methyl ester carboxylesterase
MILVQALASFLLILVPVFVPVAAVAVQQPPGPPPPREEIGRAIGTYDVPGGGFVSIFWLEDLGGLLLIDYPGGRIRALRRDGPDSYTIGPAVLAAAPVQARLGIDAGGLAWTETGRTRRAARAAFRREDVAFASGPVRLAGTLTLPRGRGPFPAVVLLHGGGPEDRSFGWVPGFFAEAGVAVLAYDKRGVGGSSGDWRSAGQADLAGDALAAVALLRGRPDVDAGRIGLYGSSNGGWTAPLAATMAPDRIAFVVARAASGVAQRENVVFEMTSDLRNAGFDESAIAAARALHAHDIALVRSGGEGWNAFRAELAAAAHQPWFRLARLPPDIEELNAANRPGILRWIEAQRREWIEPPSLWARLSCPILLQSGTSDIYTPATRSAALIRAAFAHAGNRRAEFRLYRNGDHALFESAGGTLADVARVRRFTPGYLTDLRAWLGRYVTGPGAPRGRGCALSPGDAPAGRRAPRQAGQARQG